MKFIAYIAAIIAGFYAFRYVKMNRMISSNNWKKLNKGMQSSFSYMKDTKNRLPMKWKKSFN
ncbi:hypothetical protein [Priestia taiwanensis]|uniref:Uncharacterized protein n=1 Tax=Priestia taiwanensis TaxID=1347902 RepID=A0A917AW42_9BACI|nr:hypothetical protein [Priestia taiwanensis]MBM7363672.1 hypothetical protein [Priestia taiwanensis]GGE75034.1 hypothetical protein GCM10007140_26140 [Priestia taiwanensis]